MQGVGDERLFLNLFKQRCRDIDGQGWVNGLSKSPKLDTYKHFKSLLQYESYLSNIDKMIFRTTLCRFRASNHNLAIEKGRRDGVSRDRRICIFCNIGNFIEDEFHFCLICPVYQQLRELYIPQYFFQPPSQFKFYSLMRTNHVHTQNNLAKFVFFCFSSTSKYDRLILVVFTIIMWICMCHSCSSCHNKPLHLHVYI